MRCFRSLRSRPDTSQRSRWPQSWAASGSSYLLSRIYKPKHRDRPKGKIYRS